MKRLWLLSICVASVALISACGQNGADQAQPASQEAVVESAEQEPDEEGTLSDEPQEELPDMEYREPAQALQEIIGDRDMEKIASYVSYPCYIGYADGGDVIVESEEDFLNLDAGQVFSDALIQAVKDADVSSIELVKAGLVVGDASGKPNVTFGLGGDGTIGITGINN